MNEIKMPERIYVQMPRKSESVYPMEQTVDWALHAALRDYGGREAIGLLQTSSISSVQYGTHVIEIPNYFSRVLFRDFIDAAFDVEKLARLDLNEMRRFVDVLRPYASRLDHEQIIKIHRYVDAPRRFVARPVANCGSGKKRDFFNHTEIIEYATDGTFSILASFRAKDYKSSMKLRSHAMRTIKAMNEKIGGILS